MRLPGLTSAQQRLVDRWLPGADLVADMGWPARLTTVLHVRTPAHDAVVEAGGEVTGHHISREIAAGTALRGLGPGLPTLIAGSAAERPVTLHHQPAAPAVLGGRRCMARRDSRPGAVDGGLGDAGRSGPLPAAGARCSPGRCGAGNPWPRRPGARRVAG